MEERFAIAEKAKERHAAKMQAVEERERKQAAAAATAASSSNEPQRYVIHSIDVDLSYVLASRRNDTTHAADTCCQGGWWGVRSDIVSTTLFCVKRLAMAFREG